jgi:hypothetical protein
MHEVELGIWKSLMVHLLRILNSVGENVVNELDRRLADGLSLMSLCYTLTRCDQVSSCAHLWARYHQALHSQYIRAEEDGRQKL